jgi:hypothetical protein
MTFEARKLYPLCMALSGGPEELTQLGRVYAPVAPCGLLGHGLRNDSVHTTLLFAL